MTDRHAVRRYATGIGHIDARGGRFLVSFYGPGTVQTVRQAWADTLQAARQTLRTLARG